METVNRVIRFILTIIGLFLCHIIVIAIINPVFEYKVDIMWTLIFVCFYFYVFKALIFNIYVWIRYSELLTKWNFWLCSLVNLSAIHMAFAPFMGFKWENLQAVMWVFVFIPLPVILLQNLACNGLRGMIRTWKDQEGNKEAWNHGMSYTLKFLWKLIVALSILYVVILILQEWLWEELTMNIIVGGISLLILFLLIWIPFINIRAWIRYPQLRTKWQFWLSSFLDFFLLFSACTLLFGWIAQTLDIIMMEFVSHAPRYLFWQLIVYIWLNEMIQHCKKQEREMQKWENILPNPEKWLHSGK